MNKSIEIYADGACSYQKKGKPGGFGIIIRENGSVNYKKEKGYYHETTNNRMELTAFFHALFNAAVYETQKYTVKIFIDSAYVYNGITKWAKKWQNNDWLTVDNSPVQNKDLWEKIIVQYSVLENTEIVKIKGHDGNKWHDLADQVAKSMVKLAEEIK